MYSVLVHMLFCFVYLDFSITDPHHICGCSLLDYYFLMKQCFFDKHIFGNLKKLIILYTISLSTVGILKYGTYFAGLVLL